MRKGFALPLILLIIVFSMIAVGIGYFIFTSKQTTQPQPTTITQSTSSPEPATKSSLVADESQKTYTNENYLFSFNHPTDFVVTEKPNISGGQFTIELKNQTEELVLDIQAESSVPNWPGNTGYARVKTLNSIEWKIFSKSNYCDAGQCSDTSVIYRTSYKNNSYHFILRTISEKKGEDLISTFKFLK